MYVTYNSTLRSWMNSEKLEIWVGRQFGVDRHNVSEKTCPLGMMIWEMFRKNCIDRGWRESCSVTVRPQIDRPTILCYVHKSCTYDPITFIWIVGTLEIWGRPVCFGKIAPMLCWYGMIRYVRTYATVSCRYVCTYGMNIMINVLSSIVYVRITGLAMLHVGTLSIIIIHR